MRFFGRAWTCSEIRCHRRTTEALTTRRPVVGGRLPQVRNRRFSALPEALGRVRSALPLLDATAPILQRPLRGLANDRGRNGRRT